jgi:uncharacterized membrane-anchored protein YhcB (DUF1043 family)
MKTRSWLWGIGFAATFILGVVAVLAVLVRRVDGLIKNQNQIDAQLAELRADVEAANTEILILRAELDLRQEQLRRLLEEDGGEWGSLN